MAKRDFSDSIKLDVIKDNLRKNNGIICCELCGKQLLSMDECHFDHIMAYIKGGSSKKDNCQILCSDCNLKKNDKEWEDMMLEEKALAFFSGKDINTDSSKQLQSYKPHNNMSKEIFDKLVYDFIQENGDIKKIDFTKENNQLPSPHYISKYYGTLSNLKKSFGLVLQPKWTRELIEQSLTSYIEEYGDLKQSDLIKKNGLPSLPCILQHFPEYSSFTDF